MTHSVEWEVTSWYYRVQESVTDGFRGLEFVLFLYEAWFILMGMYTARITDNGVLRIPMQFIVYFI